MLPDYEVHVRSHASKQVPPRMQLSDCVSNCAGVLTQVPENQNNTPLLCQLHC